MSTAHLTFLLFQIIALIDGGKHEGVTFGEVKDALRSGSLIKWLNSRFPGEFDTSPYTGDRAASGQEVLKALAEAADALDGRERKKTGVEHNGICLLAALVTEAVQDLARNAPK